MSDTLDVSINHINDHESSSAEQELKERLKSLIDRHVVKVPIGWNGEAGEKINEPFAVVDGVVERCNPPLRMERVILEKGRVKVLIGPNGAGKSTFFDAIMQRDNAFFDQGSYGYDKGFHTSEELRIARLDQEEVLEGLQGVEVSRVLELILEQAKEDFEEDWTDDSKYEQNMSAIEAKQRMDEVLSRYVKLFEIDRFMDRTVEGLSGGERTKLALMTVLLAEPDILLLDEPTNHLDIESIAKLIGVFDAYKSAGASIIAVSHVDWFLKMAGNEGTISLTVSDKERCAQDSSSPYEKFVRGTDSRPLMTGGIEWRYREKPPKQQPFIIGSGVMTVENSPIKDTLIPNISGTEITVLTGKNGTGKTRFMEALVNKGSGVKWESGLQLGYLPQIWPEEVLDGSFEDFWNWVKEGTNKHTDIAFSRFTKLLRDVEFSSMSKDIHRKKFKEFSGGEQRLLWFLAQSLFDGTDMLVLDEPTNHMDEKSVRIIVDALRKFQGGVVLSTHDLRLMEALDEDAGKNRQDVRNMLFSSDDERRTIIKEVQISPIYQAQETIKRARKEGRRSTRV